MKDRIKMVRESITENGKKVSQTRFAELTHISRDMLASYETGRVIPTDIFINYVCTTFGVNERWLKTGEGEMRSPQSREAEIARITAQMFREDESSFRYQLQKLIADLNEDQLVVLRDIAKKLVEIMETENNESLPK